MLGMSNLCIEEDCGYGQISSALIKRTPQRSLHRLVSWTRSMRELPMCWSGYRLDNHCTSGITAVTRTGTAGVPGITTTCGCLTIVRLQAADFDKGSLILDPKLGQSWGRMVQCLLHRHKPLVVKGLGISGVPVSNSGHFSGWWLQRALERTLCLSTPILSRKRASPWCLY